MNLIPFRVSNDSLMVTVNVNGVDIECIIDTGDAIGPVFNGDDAEKLGLKSLGVIGVSGAGGATENYGCVANIKLGNFEFDNEPGAIDPHLQGPSLLGLPFFLKFVKSAVHIAFDFTSDDTGSISIGTGSVNSDERIEVIDDSQPVSETVEDTTSSTVKEFNPRPAMPLSQYQPKND